MNSIAVSTEDDKILVQFPATLSLVYNNLQAKAAWQRKKYNHVLVTGFA
ncbi:MAG: hypothetical protein SFU87_11865 [Chitinophagaceae bacterium]|nr:hypothetical protein [Chitinophagaceae bacterium]